MVSYNGQWSYFGPVRGTTSRGWVAVACPCWLIRTLSRHRTMFACSVSPSRRTSAEINMSPAFVQHVFSGFVSSDEFKGLWTMSPSRYSFTPLSRRGWITATRYSLVHQGLWQTNCNACWTLQHILSAARASMTVDWRGFCMLTCTGSMWQIRSGTSSVLQCTDVCIW